jgi:hypothetical protein
MPGVRSIESEGDVPNRWAHLPIIGYEPSASC